MYLVTFQINTIIIIFMKIIRSLIVICPPIHAPIYPLFGTPALP